MPLERRRARQLRFPVRVPALLLERVEPAAHPTPGETRNISRGGVGLRVEKAPSSGVPVEVGLRLVFRLPLTLTGTVVWREAQPTPPGWHLGIQFDEELPPRVIAEIADEGFRIGTGPAE